MIHSFSCENFRNVSCEDLEFERINILIGANNAGKILSAGHDVQIVDLQNNGFFGHGETVITETSILVTYVAMAVAFVTAIATEIWSAFK